MSLDLFLPDMDAHMKVVRIEKTKFRAEGDENNSQRKSLHECGEAVACPTPCWVPIV